MISLQVIGNLGADAETNTVGNNQVINFSVAHNERFKDRNGQMVDRTVWIRCAYWRDQTTLAQYLRKGTQVFVEGIPSAEAYTDKSGQPAAALRLRVNRVELLGSASGGSNDAQNQERQSANATFVPPPSDSMSQDSDDLPF
ncbi:MAG: single-stranded DNA-binding protein [Sphingobacteriia bacterium]|jgi:single-strand DNA-binding protein|nr:single-stranded DNA-binding protein [Sphingobacteriia bacterium]